MVHWEVYREEGLPEQLLLYRVVMDNPDHPRPCPPEEQCLIGIRAMFVDKPQEYWRQRTALETAYEERKLAEIRLKEKEAQAQAPSALSSWDGKGPCPTCKREQVQDGGTRECLEKMRKWLEVHGE